MDGRRKRAGRKQIRLTCYIQNCPQATTRVYIGSFCLRWRSKELYHHNSKRLDAIIDCIILCGKQNISLRGHRDANCSSHNATNKGNFKAILEFRALGDPVL